MKYSLSTLTVGIMIMISPTYAQREQANPAQPKVDRDPTSLIRTPPYVQESEDLKKSAHQGDYVRLSQFLGANVKAEDGQKLGQIDELVIVPQTRQIRFAVLAKGGVFGIGQSLAPVPWRAINVRSGRDYAINMSRKAMASAPTVEQGGYGDLDRPEFITRVHEFYSVQTEAVGSPGPQEGSRSEPGSGQSQPREREEVPPRQRD
jgi:sporulation protein YlmC with PRC-barrel domain